MADEDIFSQLQVFEFNIKKSDKHKITFQNSTYNKNQLHIYLW